MATTTAITITHPDWCDPAFCDASAGPADVRHLSAPFTFHGTEGDVEFQLFRYQVAGGRPGYLWRIRDLGVHAELEVPVSVEDVTTACIGIERLGGL